MTQALKHYEMLGNLNSVEKRNICQISISIEMMMVIVMYYTFPLS